MTSITIEVQGVEKTVATFSRIAEGLTRLRPLMERFGAEFYREEKSLFERQPWKPLSPEYARRKAKKFPGKGILRATDTLFRSLTQQGAEGNVHRTGDDSAEFGSIVPYGPFHVATRDPMAEPDEDRYATIAGEYINEIVEKAA